MATNGIVTKVCTDIVSRLIVSDGYERYEREGSLPLESRLTHLHDNGTLLLKGSLPLESRLTHLHDNGTLLLKGSLPWESCLTHLHDNGTLLLKGSLPWESCLTLTTPKL